MKSNHLCECGRQLEYEGVELNKWGDCAYMSWQCGCGRKGRDVYDLEYSYRQTRRLAYEVYEDNGGGITLFVLDGDKAIWAGSGYEYDSTHSNLLGDIRAINDGGYPIADGWETDVDDPQAFYDEVTRWATDGSGGAQLVADSAGVYRQHMGAAASLIFGSED
ncbi:MAG: hypothetical protein UEP80_07635 [Senegalimassilia anaerobia]|nr:hypothetical protein [Senegalimassilia anaerobia]